MSYPSQFQVDRDAFYDQHRLSVLALRAGDATRQLVYAITEQSAICDLLPFLKDDWYPSFTEEPYVRTHRERHLCLPLEMRPGAFAASQDLWMAGDGDGARRQRNQIAKVIAREFDRAFLAGLHTFLFDKYPDQVMAPPDGVALDLSSPTAMTKEQADWLLDVLHEMLGPAGGPVPETALFMSKPMRRAYRVAERLVKGHPDKPRWVDRGPNRFGLAVRQHIIGHYGQTPFYEAPDAVAYAEGKGERIFAVWFEPRFVRCYQRTFPQWISDDQVSGLQWDVAIHIGEPQFDSKIAVAVLEGVYARRS